MCAYCLLLTTHYCSLYTPCTMWKCRFFIVQCTHTRLYSVMFYSKDHVCSIMYFWPMIHKYLMCITILIKREKKTQAYAVYNSRLSIYYHYENDFLVHFYLCTVHTHITIHKTLIITMTLYIMQMKNENWTMILLLPIDFDSVEFVGTEENSFQQYNITPGVQASAYMPRFQSHPFSFTCNKTDISSDAKVLLCGLQVEIQKRKKWYWAFIIPYSFVKEIILHIVILFEKNNSWFYWIAITQHMVQLDWCPKPSDIWPI